MLSEPGAAAPAWRQDLRVVLLGAVLLLAWEGSGLDLPLSRLFGTAGGFAWRHHGLLQQVLHDGAAWCARALFVLLGLNVLVPLPLIGAMPRALRLRWWAVALLCAVLIGLLKRHSLVSCPWSAAEFGGSALPLARGSLDAWWGVGDGGPGHCFPAGHAANAFSFLVGGMALRTVSARAARAWLVGVCTAGLVLGLTQLVRGAHFASHSLWTAWICWTVSVLAWQGAGRVSVWRLGWLQPR